MIVWTVITGERHHGGTLLSIHLTRETAITSALATTAYFEGGWTPDPEEVDTWVNGCDWLQVSPWKVEA